MANTTADKNQDEATSARTPEQEEALARLIKMAEEQGVKPLDFDALRAKADFWPEDESIDDFIATIRRWRDEGDEIEEVP
ncbi:MAG TPA: hypothetical protein VNO70_01060 [Blastocatellia bacterium]|nr:hypothetical protein [Blastocatellia bacterium]